MEGNVELINALNVFPVPDGDTGTNMFLTMRDVMKETEDVQNAAAGESASAMARAALMGARGNSGVILSQFFKGIALELDGKSDFDASDLASGFVRSRAHAYSAVGQPVEGTVLTVISSVGGAAKDCAEAGGALQEMFDAVCDAARETVALTPTMLPVLRDAGVVDAGGHGMLVLLEAMRLYARGQEIEVREIPPPEPVGIAEGAGEVSASFLEATDEEMYGYCTQFLIQGEGLSPEAVRERMTSLADSTVVVGDDTMIKVHVHAEEPEAIISIARSMGSVSQVNIDSMDEQHRQYSMARRGEASAEGTGVGASSISVVAVVSGQGLETVFADLGAAEVVPGGDTMNPSIQEILKSVDSAPSDSVIFLPNNRNIVAAAQQAIQVSRKTLKVVPSTTIPQGIAAMLAFNPKNDLADSLSAMERVLPSVRTGEVCQAVRPALLSGVTVKEGQIIGLLERELVAAGDEPNEVLMMLLLAAGVSEGDLITLYWGRPTTEEEADNARQRVVDYFPGAEVEAVGGDQPYYHYIVSIE